MGYYRLFLAYVVAFSHVGFDTGGFNPGEAAVVSFFLLSGYVMTALIDKHYKDIRKVGRFYVDRALRLYPQFLVYALATIIGAECFGLRHYWMPNAPSLSSDLAQLAMLPLGLQERFSAILMPQGWSLSLELIFDNIFPFVLINRHRRAVALWSATIFILGYIGTLTPDWFCYRLPPGVLFVFILGSWIYRPEHERGRAFVVGAFVVAAILLVCGLSVFPRRAVVSDVLFGLIVGLLVLFGLSKLRDLGALDRLAGDLSYGVFLNHYLILVVIRHFAPEITAPTLFLATVPISLALSYITFQWVERPIIALRRRLRPDHPAERPAYRPFLAAPRPA